MKLHEKLKDMKLHEKLKDMKLHEKLKDMKLHEKLKDMKLHEKLKDIRIRLLKVNQSSIALAVGFFQKDISLLETSHKEFIPNKYLEYLAKKNVDLNSLFHPDKKVCFLSEPSSELIPLKTAEAVLYEIRDLLSISNK